MNEQTQRIADLEAELRSTKRDLKEIQDRYRGLPQDVKDKRIDVGSVESERINYEAALKVIGDKLSTALIDVAERDKALLRILVIVADVHGIQMTDVMKLVQKK